MVKIIRRGYETGYGGHGIFIPEQIKKSVVATVMTMPEPMRTLPKISPQVTKKPEVQTIKPPHEIIKDMLPPLPPPHEIIKSLIFGR